MGVMTVLALLAMVLTMLGTGLGLHGRDFLRVQKMPAAVLIGLALQVFLVPMALVLLVTGVLPADDLSLGLALVGLLPATAASHAFVGLAGGNIGLSRSLTAWSSLTFLVVAWAADLAELLPNLVPVLGFGYVLPLAVGIGLAALRPQLAVRAEQPVFMAASVLTGLVVFATLWLNLHPALIGQFLLALIFAITVGLFGGVAGGLSGNGKGEAMGITLAMKNVAVMMAVCWAAGSGWFAASAAIYAVAMYLAVFALIFFWRRIGRR